jgi:hypothetical protein
VLVVVLPVGIDLFNGYLVMTGREGMLSVGVLFRGGIVLFGVYCLFMLKERTCKAFLFCLIAIFFLNNLVWSIFSINYDLFFELDRFVKICFSWFILVIFLHLDERFGIDKKFVFKLMAVVGFLTALSILLIFAVGLSFKSYGDYSYGIKGFFNAQNDTGLTMLLSLVAAIVVYLNRPRFRYLMVIMIITIGCLMLGTRAGFLGPFVIFGSFGIAAIFNRKIIVPDGMSGAVTAVLLIVMSLLLVGGVMFIFRNFEKIDYLLNKVEQLRDEAPRSRLQAAASERIKSRGLLFDLFGEGALQFRKHVGRLSGKGNKDTNTRMYGTPVENDVYDVFGNYGFIFFTWIYFWIIYLALFSFVSTVLRFNRHNVAILMIVLLYLGHSSIAGHAIVSPQVGNVIGPLFFLIWVTIHRRPSSIYVGKSDTDMHSIEKALQFPSRP